MVKTNGDLEEEKVGQYLRCGEENDLMNCSGRVNTSAWLPLAPSQTARWKEAPRKNVTKFGLSYLLLLPSQILGWCKRCYASENVQFKDQVGVASSQTGAVQPFLLLVLREAYDFGGICGKIMI